MDIKIYNPPVKGPEAGHENWEFDVRVTTQSGQNSSVFSIADIDLQKIAKTAIGRSLDHSSGVKNQKTDLDTHWEKIEPLLNAFVKQWFENHPEALEGVA